MSLALLALAAVLQLVVIRVLGELNPLSPRDLLTLARGERRLSPLVIGPLLIASAMNIAMVVVWATVDLETAGILAGTLAGMAALYMTAWQAARWLTEGDKGAE